MNTSVTQCPRCGGQAGAHFGFCFVAQLWERLMGPGYPWAPPAPPEDDIPLPPEPTDTDWAMWEDEAELFDPPDPAGVYEDFAVGSGLVESDAVWMPEGLKSSITVTTEPVKPGRTYNTGPMLAAHEAKLKAQEDAAVVFVYDCCDLDVPGGRVPLADLHQRYLDWHKANDMPSMSKERLRALLGDIGVVVQPGRLPGTRKAGRAPLLVHGLALKQEPLPAPVEPKVVIAPPKPRKHALVGAKPGSELPKQVRDLITPLVTEQGWEYQPHNSNGQGKPRLKSPDGKVCTLPTSPHSNGHTLENTRSFLKQNGALL